MNNRWADGRGRHRSCVAERFEQVYTAWMNVRVRMAQATGTVTTIIAGVLLAALSISAFGAVPTLVGFFALSLIATATHRAIARHR
jgi:hypothetical protein